MRLSAARGRKVVAMNTAATVGRLDDFVIDARTARVVALRLRKTRVRASMLPWSDVHGFGDDAITVADAGRIVEPDRDLAELASKSSALLRKRVLSTAGVDLGQATDVDIDTATGEVVVLLLPNGTIAGSRLVGAGPYAVVVRA
jgi:sporulation protein YlmC with PRC-barrel domain